MVDKIISTSYYVEEARPSFNKVVWKTIEVRNSLSAARRDLNKEANKAPKSTRYRIIKRQQIHRVQIVQRSKGKGKK